MFIILFLLYHKSMRATWKVFVVVVILAIFTRVFIIDSFIVHGDSMAPTILSGDYIFINKLSYRKHDPQRTDIVVINRSPTKEANIIKRIIALPGEWVEISNNKITIKTSRNDTGEVINEPYIASIGTPEIGIRREYLDPQEYFVMGDNRYASVDSRELGPIDRWDIKGRVFIIFRLRDFSIDFI
jgi:signal peptidase I